MYRNGTVFFSKEALSRLDKGDILGGAFKKNPNATSNDDQVKMKNEKKEKQRLTYDDIMKQKEENEEFRTGKKFKKARGAAGKIHRKFKSGGGKKKKSFGKKKH